MVKREGKQKINLSEDFPKMAFVTKADLVVIFVTCLGNILQSGW